MAESKLQPEVQLVVSNTPEHARNGEADIIELKNGDLLLGYGRWDADGSDFGRAEIWSKTSHDGGKTWGEDRVLVPNEGKRTTFECGMLRLPDGAILMSYCVKDSEQDCAVCFRKSLDDGRTWVNRFKYQVPPGYAGYTGINNDRLVLLKSGRILLPVYDGWVGGRVLLSFVLYSDDNAETWKKSADVDMRDLDPNDKWGAGEPAVVELKDGQKIGDARPRSGRAGSPPLLMIIRTKLGIIAKAYSNDRGATWSKPQPIKGIVSPCAPSSIARLPQTGDLLLVWNNTTTTRDPLNCAISKDDGETWENIRVLDRGGSLCYTSITPVGDRVLLTYYKFPEGLKLQALPYRWFYDRD
jgi:sialidase-1